MSFHDTKNTTVAYLDEGLGLFHLNVETLKKVMQIFTVQLERGLKKHGPKTSIKALLTYVQDLPTGRETGEYVGVEVNDQLCHVMMLSCKTTVNTKLKSYKLPPNTVHGVQFFDILARFIAEAILQFGIGKTSISIGLIFAFPLQQKGLHKGILIKWTKDIAIKGVVGKDIVALMNTALSKRPDIDAKVVAITNDSTAILLTAVYDHPTCKIGVIIDAGTNASYVEKLKNVENFNKENKGSGHFVINTEWGAFGDIDEIDFIRLPYDMDLDKRSHNPGTHRFEKMTGTVYLGELCRIIFVKYIKEGFLMDHEALLSLNRKNAFSSNFVFEIEQETGNVHNLCRRIFMQVGIPDLTDRDCICIRHICHVVVKRSAYLVAALIAALINKINAKDIVVGVTGAPFTSFDNFQRYLMHKIKDLVFPHIQFKLKPVTESNCKGAALLACIASNTVEQQEPDVAQSCFPCRKIF